MAMAWLSLLAVLSATLLAPAAAVAPVVDLGYSRYNGTALPNNVSQWLGIRYAAAPVGDLRFMPPRDPPSVTQIQDATKVRQPLAGFCRRVRPHY